MALLAKTNFGMGSGHVKGSQSQLCEDARSRTGGTEQACGSSEKYTAPSLEAKKARNRTCARNGIYNREEVDRAVDGCNHERNRLCYGCTRSVGD